VRENIGSILQLLSSPSWSMLLVGPRDAILADDARKEWVGITYHRHSLVLIMPSAISSGLNASGVSKRVSDAKVTNELRFL
jgi:hypothetical protein